VPRHRLSTVGRRAFAVHGPMVWNSLPDDLRARQHYESFRQGLKACLFSRYYRVQRIRDFVIIAIYKSTFTIPYDFSYSFTANSPRNLPVKFLKGNWVRFGRIMAIHEFVASLFGPPCIQYIAATPPTAGQVRGAG